MKTIFANYEVDETGKVFHNGRELSQLTNPNGYSTVKISGGNFLVHRLVAAAYIPNPLALPYVNHKDGNKLNNAADNLEWISARQNVLHSYANHLQGRYSKDRPGKKIVCIETGEVFDSIMDATNKFNKTSCTTLWKCLHKIEGVPTAWGYHWDYQNPK